MQGLHLPGPHLCPACNIVHDLNKEVPLLPAVLSKLSHQGTYLPIASNGQSAPTRCWGNFGSGGVTTMVVNENSISGLVVTGTAYPYTFSVGRSGWYFISSVIQVYQHASGAHYWTISTTRGSRTSNPAVASGNGDIGTGTYWEGVLLAGDGITLSGTEGPYTWSGDNSFAIDFVPTPQYRK